MTGTVYKSVFLGIKLCKRRQGILLWQETNRGLKVKGINEATPGEYVEFAVVLHKNPLIEVLETIHSFGRLAQDVEESSDSQAKHNGSSKRGSTKGGGGGQQPKQQSATSQMLQQIDVLLKSLRGDEGGTFDLIGNIAGSDLQAVLMLDPNFASDPASADLVDGDYTVLGKVVRVIQADSQEKINLLRKASLGKALPLVEQLVKGLATLDGHGITFPTKIETELSGPVIQVVPIAIFM
jgi:hypothetical protein